MRRGVYACASAAEAVEGFGGSIAFAASCVPSSLAPSDPSSAASPVAPDADPPGPEASSASIASAPTSDAGLEPRASDPAFWVAFFAPSDVASSVAASVVPRTGGLRDQLARDRLPAAREAFRQQGADVHAQHEHIDWIDRRFLQRGFQISVSRASPFRSTCQTVSPRRML